MSNKNVARQRNNEIGNQAFNGDVRCWLVIGWVPRSQGYGHTYLPVIAAQELGAPVPAGHHLRREAPLCRPEHLARQPEVSELEAADGRVPEEVLRLDVPAGSERNKNDEKKKKGLRTAR